MTNPSRFQPQLFESKWISQWSKDQLYSTPDISKSKKKSYILDMFPYPSGAGLHVGHVEGYTATDIYCRYLRMKGYKVLHPMGFDSFGLPAENYAIKTGTHPKITTEAAIETFTKQMKSLGLSYDWNLELAAHRPNYYKWTQWLFLLMYKRGLAYRKKQAVNWCTGCQTVLANEQVVDTKCERCDSVVIQKDMEQWFLKITDYAERLLQDLDRLDWPESTKAGQRNWIGKSEGAIIKFQIPNSKFQIEVFSTAPDTIYGATFLVLAPENLLVDQITTQECKEKVENYKNKVKLETEIERSGLIKEKTGVYTGAYAINPANGKQIPIWISNYVLITYGTGAIMAVPGHDVRDFEFAQAMHLPIVRVVVAPDGDKGEITDVEQVQEAEGLMINSEFLDGMDIINAKDKIMDHMVENGYGKRVVNYKLRDWLISRQRFWGAPIPMKKFRVPSSTFQENVFEYKPVNEAELPVVLPMDVEFKPTGKSPLTTHPDFADRECDTMDTFVDSSWYFMRFAQLTSTKLRDKVLQQKEDDNPFDDNNLTKILNAWCPVDLYVGGAEHTVLHLLYSRFFTKVLFDAGYINFDEPFTRLRHQGTIMGPDHRKMSKRWGNVINPLDVVGEYGADTLRMYEMFMGPLEQMKAWNVNNVAGIYRFLTRVWNISQSVIASSKDTKTESNLLIELHKTIKKISEDIPELKFNTSIASLMEFVNAWEKAGALCLSVDDLEKLLTVLAPFAPFMTEELWSLLGHSKSIHIQSWPTYDADLLVTDYIQVPIQVNGKVRAVITIQRSEINDQQVIENAAKADPAVQKYLTKNIVKVVYIPEKIVNIVCK